MKHSRIHHKFFKIVGEQGVWFCLSARHDAKMNVTSVTAYKVHSDPCKRARRIISSPDDLRHLRVVSNGEALGAIYNPISAQDGMKPLHTITPDSMSSDIQAALNKLHDSVGNVKEFVCERLQWRRDEIGDYINAEQVDAVGLAIYNMEARRQGIIIGDQTGIGKGRMAASIIRYAVVNGTIPVFVTEKPNLFSDMYRDLKGIGCEGYRPFIVNADNPKSRIIYNDDEICRPDNATVQKQVFATGRLPEGRQVVFCTYSQFAAAGSGVKQNFIRGLMPNATLILDEAHTASGDMKSKTFKFFSDIVATARNIVYLSATFAKRPDNMPLYALCTCISEAKLGSEELINSIRQGGVALQEVLAAALVREGQMLRRERGSDGVTVNYITLDKTAAKFGMGDYAKEHMKLSDDVTALLRRIKRFDDTHVAALLDDMQKKSDESDWESETEKLNHDNDSNGINRQPFASKIFNVINQVLFSIKAEAVADRAIQRLKEGKGVVIAFSNTFESLVSAVLSSSTSDIVRDDYSVSLRRALLNTLKYTKVSDTGKEEADYLPVGSLSPDGQDEYYSILGDIERTTTNIHLSPIDVIVSKIEAAGFKTAEVTGRKFKLEMQKDGYAKVVGRKKENTAKAFMDFQNNRVDCLLINQSGAVGASAHATSADTGISDMEVRQRVMIVAQPELDISKEVQKRGRINRTGQIYKPIYDYVSSAIPAERRLMMMLQKKLKSLDANTTSNQKQSRTIIDTDDFMNKYGDRIVRNYLMENEELNEELDDPLSLSKKGSDVEEGGEGRNEGQRQVSEAMKVSGRVALLSCKDQNQFYDDVTAKYKDFVNYKVDMGEYDLEVQTLKLDAKRISESVVVPASDGGSCFADAAYLGEYECNNLRKPMTQSELDAAVVKAMDGKADPKAATAETVGELLRVAEERHKCELDAIDGQGKKLLETAKSNKRNVAKVESGETTWEAILTDINSRMAERTASENARHARLVSRINVAGQFYVGKAVSFDGTKGLCLGVKTNPKAKNPTAPSEIKVDFAFASSLRTLSLNLADEQYGKLTAISSESASLTASDDNFHRANWTYLTKNASADRVVRRIITGNLLKGFVYAQSISSASPQLISFTLADSDDEIKGIMVKERKDGENGQAVRYVKLGLTNIADSIFKLIEERKNFVISLDPREDVKLSYFYGSLEIFTGNATSKRGVALTSPGGLVERAAESRWSIRNRKEAHVNCDSPSLAQVRRICKALSDLGYAATVPPAQAQLFEVRTVRTDNWKRLPYDPARIPADKKGALTDMKIKIAKAKIAVANAYVYALSLAA